MESNSHYFRVGVFVIAFIAIFIIFCLWLSVGLSGTTYDTYTVFMKESVSGLSEKASVKYNGVAVGYVSNVSLYKKNPKLVMLTLQINDKVKVYTTTKAMLETQGLTGIAYVELQGGTPDAPVLKAQKGQKYPVIQSSPSLMFRLDSALDDLTHNLNDISNGIKTVLNPENTKAVQQMIQNFNQVSDNLKRNSAKLDEIVDNTASASKQFPAVMQSVKSSAESVQNIANKLSSASNQADQAMQAASATMLNINNQLLPQVQSSLGDFQQTMANLKNFSQELDENPSIIVRGKTPSTPGPGE